jgi:hypothetical protein
LQAPCCIAANRRWGPEADSCAAAKQFYSITSSAVASKLGGMARHCPMYPSIGVPLSYAQAALPINSAIVGGGELYLVDFHPSFLVLEEDAGRLVPKYDYQTPADRPLEFVTETTYTGDPTTMTHQSTREWIHSLSAILGALIDAGLTITMFREHEVLPWHGVQSLVPASERLWRLPDMYPCIPLSFSVRARKV